MGVHGSEIVLAIRAALAGKVNDPFVQSAQAPTQSGVRCTPNPEQDWPNRDGKMEFDCMGHDWFRAFRVTVEVIDADDFQGDYGSEEWIGQQ